MADEEVESGTANSSDSSRAAQLRPYHFVKGQSGNPSGRPKGSGIIKELEKLLRLPLPADPKGRKGRLIAAEALFRLFLKGNPAVINQVLNRVEGPVPTVFEGGDPKKPIIITDAKDRLVSRLRSLAARGGPPEGDSEPE